MLESTCTCVMLVCYGGDLFAMLEGELGGAAPRCPTQLELRQPGRQESVFTSVANN